MSRAPVRVAIVVLVVSLLGAATAAPGVGAIERAGAAGSVVGDAQLPDPEPTTAESNAVADDILARLEFQPPPKSIWDRIQEWLGERFAELFGSVGSTGSNVIGWVLIIGLLVAVGFLLTRLRGTARGRDRDAGYEFDLEDDRPPHAWREDADRFERAGDWKQALRCRYRALIGDLIGLGVLRDLPGRTTGEYRIEIRSFVPGSASAFATASNLFEAAWYGDEPTGAEENRLFRVAEDEVLAAVRSALRSADAREAEPAGAP